MATSPLDVLQRDLNMFADPDRNKRRCAIERVRQLLVDPTKDPFRGAAGEEDTDHAHALLTVTKAALRLLEDSGERAREAAIHVVAELMPRQGPGVLDWVLPAVVARIGLQPVVEPSEELRLLLLKLAVQALEAFPHDIGPRNFLDYYRILLENCLKDAFPELKREACAACHVLCRVEPKAVKHLAVPLAKALKQACLPHKHGAVRAAGVAALADLILHGAAELLADMQTEQDSRTTVRALFILACDHSESVRLAVVKLLSTCLLDIVERQDQHRRLVPHLLLLMTDDVEEVRLAANTVLLSMGRLYVLDHEDNSINVEKRRINLKDIDWYADDCYPDMTMHCPTDISFPGGLKARPSLGARSVIADTIRAYLDTTLADVTALDWTIPFSNVNRRVAALRILALSIFFTETNIVQSTQQIMYSLYKALKDDNASVRQEALVCVELLGKFLTPAQYLPFIVAKPPAEAEELRMRVEEENREERTKDKVISITNADGETGSKVLLPSLLSTAASSIKASILLAFQYMLYGSRGRLSSADAMEVTKALAHRDLQVLEAPHMCWRLSDCIVAFAGIIAEAGFIATPARPMDPDMARDVTRRTLDSILFYALLALLGCEDGAVVSHIHNVCIPALAQIVAGSTEALYNMHFGRLVYRHLQEMPVAVFRALLLNATELQPYTGQITQIFLAHLTNVNFTLRVTEPLAFFEALDQLLWAGKVTFAPSELESLLRSVILEYGRFRPGGAALLFRKRAIFSLRAVLQQHLPTLFQVLANAAASHVDQYSGEPREDPSPLVEKVVSTWLGALDNTDDAEMRHSCVLVLPHMATLHLSVGGALEVVQHLLMRLNDTHDIIRLDTVRMIGVLLEKINMGGEEIRADGTLTDAPHRHRPKYSDPEGDMDAAWNTGDKDSFLPSRVDAALCTELRGHLRDVINALLLHMDDTNENVGLRPTIRDVLIELKAWQTTLPGGETPRAVVDELTRRAREVHHTPSLCDTVLAA